ncbi:MAG TPA: methionyl-tRNA formyltransferase [Patescibacteria group bacterium]
MKQNKKIIFIGTSEFASIILENLIKNDQAPHIIVSRPDKPRGRKKEIIDNQVVKFAKEKKTQLLQPEKISSIFNLLKETDPDLIIVAAYGRIIPKKIIDLPRFGSINVHPSLLPKYRGPSPIQFTLLNGDQFTGASIMLMDDKMDHGPIIAQEKHKISNRETFLTLQKELADLSSKLLIKTLPQWLNQSIKPMEQNHQFATFTKILTKKDGKIDWSKTADDIDQQIRAFDSWPGTWAGWNNKILKIHKAHPAEIDLNNQQFGQVFQDDYNNIIVRCGFGNLILDRLQMEGKKEMSAADFVRGHQNFIGSVLN